MTKLSSKLPIRFERKILAGFIGLLTLFGLLCYYTYQTNQKQIETERLVAYTNEVLLSTERILNDLYQAETGQRGYLITGNKTFLEPYVDATDSIEYNFKMFQQFTAASAAYQAQLDTLWRLIQHRLQRMRENLALMDKEGFETVKDDILSMQGKTLMREIRRHIDTIQRVETRLLAQRKNENSKQIAHFNVAYFVSITFAGLLLVGLFYVVYRNIFARNKAELALRKSLKDITDYKLALDESCLVAITDSKGIIRYVNNKFCELSQYHREELLGQDHRIINSGFHSKSFITNLWKTISKGKVWRGEIKNKAKDGTHYWVNTTIVPFLDSSLKPYQFIAIRFDISRRKRAEAKLQKLTGKLEKAVEERTAELMLVNKSLKQSSELFNEMGKLAKVGGWEITLPDMAMHWTAEVYRIHELNPGKMPTVEEGINFYEPQARPVIRKAVDDAMTSAKSWDLDLPFVTAKGNHLWVRAKGDVEVNEGKPIRIFGTFQDITEQKRARDQIKKLNEDLERRVAERTSQLESANHELESFSYSVSHDLRAPLRSISGYSLALIEDYGSQLDQEASRLLHKVINNARRMGQLIDDLLEFSRLGRQSLSRTELNMNEFVRQIADEIVSGVKGHIIDLNIKPLCNVQGDFSMIRQVWINLLSNALKYSEKKERSTIEIGCIHSIESKKTFYVRDNGAGFDMAYSHKLFGVFQRLHKEQEFEGTGVGLALTKRIIEKHGGEIWAEARVNEGATFYFTLPAYEQVNVA